MILNTEARINERTLARMRMAAGSRSGDLFLSTGLHRGGLVSRGFTITST